MKKRLLFAAMAMVCAMGSSAYEVGDYVYTLNQRVKITGENLVTNGNFAEGTDGWIDAAGEAINTEVWSYVEGAGPNGENVLQSMSGSTADAALCQKWDLPTGTYIVMYDIKGEATSATFLNPAWGNCVDFFLTETANPLFTRTKDLSNSDTNDDEDGTINVATTDGYKDNWKTNAYYFEVGDGQSLVMHIEKLTANTQITNIQLYQAEEVYDDRIIRNKLEYVDRLVATGKFTKDTDNEFISNIVEMLRGMLQEEGALDDKASIEGMMASYEDEQTLWLNANGGDILKDEKRWSAYGDTRKAFHDPKAPADFGGWDGQGDSRWFHKNNGGSNIITDDGDEIGYRYQGGMEAKFASLYYPVTPKAAGTYMFSMDIVGHYMAGTDGKAKCAILGNTRNYMYDWNRDFKGVTMFAGKDLMGSDAEANAAMNIEQQNQKVDCGIISNCPQTQKRYVVFYEVTQADVDAGTPIYFGITYIPDPERQGGKLGSNVNVANPQIILLGETQEEIDYRNEVAAIITQQGPLKERLDWAREDMLKTAADDRPWGHTDLQTAIDTWQPVYDESITIIDASGNVLNEGFIREKLAAHEADEANTLYSADLLAAVQAMNSARSAFTRANAAIANYRAAVAAAELVLNDVMNATGNMGALQNQISLAKEKLNEVLGYTTEETREADEATLAAQLEILAAAVEEFKASVKLEPFIDIDFSNAFEANPEGGYIIRGNKGEMTFAEGVANPDNNNDITNPDKGIGNMTFAKGFGEELLDVLRVGKGEATVAVDPEAYTDKDVLRFNFDVWFLQLSNGNLWVNLLNAQGQRVAGFKYLAYNDTETYNDFNNAENTGLDFNSNSTPSNKTGDAGSCTDSNKSSFSLIVNYGTQTLQGIVASAKGTYAGAELPFRTADDDGNAIEDTKIVSFVLGSDFNNYVGRRCWFDNLQAYQYPSVARTVGDTNNDGSVDVADISAIITAMASGDESAAYDVNGDGSVDVADISSVITIMATR